MNTIVEISCSRGGRIHELTGGILYLLRRHLLPAQIAICRMSSCAVSQYYTNQPTKPGPLPGRNLMGIRDNWYSLCSCGVSYHSLNNNIFQNISAEYCIVL